MRSTEDIKSPAACTQHVGQAGRNRTWLVLVGILLLTIAAYSPVLFNFFSGDDFVHLTWLKDAVVNTELIWRNFHSSWLDGTTTKFYRPLISVFMVTDYLLWRTNGLGFHITNLAFHLIGMLFFYLTMQELCKSCGRDGAGERLSRIWPAASAAIFALYPLHPEAVSWITGRVDSIVTAFCLPAVWCYMRWRLTKRTWLLPASLTCFVLALLSKEMAITVPAVLVSWELSRAIDGNVFTAERFSLISAGRTVAANTLPFWIIIAGYFCIRRLALGTFVGGYDDSLLFIADPKAFVLGWLHAARMTVIPINRELIGVHSLWTKAWETFLLSTTALGAYAFARRKIARPQVLFLILWLALCLVPVYKIFAISDDLQGSRLAYLATVPLSGLLAFGISAIGRTSIRVLSCLTVALLSAFLLWTNNQPWREAGMTANAIRSSFADVYSRITGDPQVLVVGLPDQVHGAYVCRNAVWGMLKQPQFMRDINNCLPVNGFDTIQPFGHVKDSLAENRAVVNIFRWDDNDRALKTVALPAPGGVSQPLPLQIIRSDARDNTRPFVLIDASPVACWNVNFVKAELDIAQPGESDVGADLLFANSLTPDFVLGNRTHAPMIHRSGKQALVFPLRALTQWSFGTSPARLKLLLPPNCKATVSSVVVLPVAALMPRLTFENDGYLGTKGYVHLGSSHRLQVMHVDASSIPQAHSCQLEITHANLQFEEQNCHSPSKNCGRMLPAPLAGSLTLASSSFKSKGMYQARLWALDRSGKIVGVASDHINISVD